MLNPIEARIIARLKNIEVEAGIANCLKLFSIAHIIPERLINIKYTDIIFKSCDASIFVSVGNPFTIRFIISCENIIIKRVTMVY